MSKFLKSAESIFQKRGMFVENINKTCITVSLDMESLPFLYLIHDKVEFNGIIMCLAVDYDNAYDAADITLSLGHIAPTLLGDKFYINPEGELYWGDEAQHAYTLDGLDVAQMEGPSKLWN